MDNLAPALIVRKRPLPCVEVPEVEISAAKRVRMSADLTPPVLIESAIFQENQDVPALEVDPDSCRGTPPEKKVATKADSGDLSTTDSGNPRAPVAAEKVMSTTGAIIGTTNAGLADVSPSEKVESSAQAIQPCPPPEASLPEGDKEMEKITGNTSESPAETKAKCQVYIQPQHVNDSIKEAKSEDTEKDTGPPKDEAKKSVHILPEEEGTCNEKKQGGSLSPKCSSTETLSPTGDEAAVVDKHVEPAVIAAVAKTDDKTKKLDIKNCEPEANWADIVGSPVATSVTKQPVESKTKDVVASSVEAAAVTDEKSSATLSESSEKVNKTVASSEDFGAVLSSKKPVPLILSDDNNPKTLQNKLAPTTEHQETTPGSIAIPSETLVEKQPNNSIVKQTPEPVGKQILDSLTQRSSQPAVNKMSLTLHQVPVTSQKVMAVTVEKDISIDVGKNEPSMSIPKLVKDEVSVSLKEKQLPTPLAKPGPSTTEMKIGTTNPISSSIEKQVEDTKLKQSLPRPEKQAPTILGKPSASASEKASLITKGKTASVVEEQVHKPLHLEKQPIAHMMKLVGSTAKKQSPSLVVGAQPTRAKPSPIAQVIQDPSSSTYRNIRTAIDISETSSVSSVSEKPLPSVPAAPRPRLPTAQHWLPPERPHVIDLIDSDDEPRSTLSHLAHAAIPERRRFQYRYDGAGHQVIRRPAPSRIPIPNRNRNNMNNYFSPPLWKQRFDLALKTGNRTMLMETLKQYPQLQRMMMEQSPPYHLHQVQNRGERRIPQMPQAQAAVVDLTGEDSEPELPTSERRSFPQKAPYPASKLQQVPLMRSVSIPAAHVRQQVPLSRPVSEAPSELQPSEKKQRLQPKQIVVPNEKVSISASLLPQQRNLSAKRYYEESDTETDDDSKEKPRTQEDDQPRVKFMTKISGGTVPAPKLNSSNEPPRKRRKIDETKVIEGGGGGDVGGDDKIVNMIKNIVVNESTSFSEEKEVQALKAVLDNATRCALLNLLGALKPERVVKLLQFGRGPEILREQIRDGMNNTSIEFRKLAMDIVTAFPSKPKQTTADQCPEYKLPSNLPKFENGLIIVFAIFSTGDDKLHYWLECAKNFVRVMTKIFPEAKFHCHTYGLTIEQQTSVSLYAPPGNMTMTDYIFDTETEGVGWLIAGARFRAAFDMKTDDTVLICDIHRNINHQLQLIAKLHALILEKKQLCGLTYWPSAEGKCPYGVNFGGLIQRSEGFSGHYHTNGGLQIWLAGSLRTHLNKQKYWEFCIEKASELRIISKGIDEIFFDWFIANSNDDRIFNNAVFLPRQSKVGNDQMSAGNGSSLSSKTIATTQKSSTCRIVEKYTVKRGMKDFFLCTGYRSTDSKKINEQKS